MGWNKVKKLLSKAIMLTAVMVSASILTSCSMKFDGKGLSEIKSGIEQGAGDIISGMTEGIKSSMSSIFSDPNVSGVTPNSDPETINSAAEVVRDSANEIADAIGSTFQEATLVRVVDGDTIVVNINNEDYKVRLIGINTPESVASQEYLNRTGKENTKEGVKASDYTKTLLGGVTTVYLEKDKSDTDRYGRLLRYVWISVPEEINTQTIAEQMLNGMLLTSGAEKAAEPAVYKPDTKYAQEFEEIYENY